MREMQVVERWREEESAGARCRIVKMRGKVVSVHGNANRSSNSAQRSGVKPGMQVCSS